MDRASLFMRETPSILKEGASITGLGRWAKEDHVCELVHLGIAVCVLCWPYRGAGEGWGGARELQPRDGHPDGGDPDFRLGCCAFDEHSIAVDDWKAQLDFPDSLRDRHGFVLVVLLPSFTAWRSFASRSRGQAEC